MSSGGFGAKTLLASEPLGAPSVSDPQSEQDAPFWHRWILRDPWFWGAIVVGLLVRLVPILIWGDIECTRDECIYKGMADKICLGTDCNARIDMVEEMRWLEYGQRLIYNQRGDANRQLG